MLPESYFNGERLKMYMDILAEFEASRKQELFTAVVDPSTVVLAVVNFPNDMEEKDLVVATVENEDDIICDFTVSSAAGTFVQVLENKKRVNRYVASWNKVIKCEFDHLRNVTVKNGQWSKHFVVSKMFITFQSKQADRQRIGQTRIPKYGVFYAQNEILSFVEGKVKDNLDLLWSSGAYLPKVRVKNIVREDYDFYRPEENGRRAFLVKIGKFVYCLRGRDFTYSISYPDFRSPDFIVDGFLVKDKGYFMFDLVYLDGFKDCDNRWRRFKLHEIYGLMCEVQSSGIFVMEARKYPYVDVTFADNGLLMIQKRGSYVNANRYKLNPHPWVHQVLVKEYFGGFALCCRHKDEIRLLAESNAQWLKNYEDKIIVVEEHENSFSLIGELFGGTEMISLEKFSSRACADVSDLFDIGQFRRLIKNDEIKKENGFDKGLKKMQVTDPFAYA